jgi:hypothetical protein
MISLASTGFHSFARVLCAAIIALAAAVAFPSDKADTNWPRLRI